MTQVYFIIFIYACFYIQTTTFSVPSQLQYTQTVQTSKAKVLVVTGKAQ